MESVTILRSSEVLNCLVKKVPAIMDAVIKKKLYATQIDAVAAIVAAHEKILSIESTDDKRAGFLLGNILIKLLVLL